jgi:hypothetical protein
LFRLVNYQAESWPASQPVVIKVEAQAQGTIPLKVAACIRKHSHRNDLNHQ